MVSLVLSVVVSLYVIGLIAAAPRFFSAAAAVKGDLRLVAFAWATVFIGQGQMFAQEQGVTSIATLSIGAMYQLAWMIVGAALIVLSMLRSRVWIPYGAIAVSGLVIYGVLGIAGAFFSPAPSLSIYKAGQILMDALLIVVAISVAARSGAPRTILDMTYLLLALVVGSAALGGVLWPDRAFKDVEGAFTGLLNGIYPQVHSNELGLLGAILLVVGIRRSVEQGIGVMRLYWVSVTVLAFTVLFYAQARTSLASALFAIIVLAFFIPRLRPLAALGVLGGLSLLFIQWFGNVELDVKGTIVETYLRRGASDEQIESLSGRLGLWQAGWEMFKDAPIFGHGMDAGVRYGGMKYGIPPGTNMHSAHFQVLVNNGATGYLAWLVFIVAVAVRLVGVLRSAPNGFNDEDGRLRLEMALVMFVILFRTLLGHVLVTHHFSFLVYDALLVCACALSVARKKPGNAVTHVEENSLGVRQRNGIWAKVR